MVDRVEVSKDIPAPAGVVWRLVSDLPRMGEWSPENAGGSWVKGATGPAPGAKFKGHNANGSKTWSTLATVIDATPDERFSFLVTVGPLKVAEWSFDIAPTEEGCTVTETWIDRRGRLMTKVGAMATGVDDRAEYNRDAMEQTLRRVAAAAVREATP